MADTLSLRGIWHECIIRLRRTDVDVANMKNCRDDAEKVELFGDRKANNIKSILVVY